MNKYFTKNNYFINIKCIYMLVLLVSFIYYMEDTIINVGLQFFLFAILFLFSMLFEVCKKQRMILVLLEILMSILLLILFDSNYAFLLPVVILDCISLVPLPMYIYFTPLLFTGIVTPAQRGLYVLFSCLTSIIYYQNHILVTEYQKTISLQEQKEYLLKNKMKEEAERNQEAMERQVLQVRESLYQRLHDRLGHVINGSIYQLEASKLLLTTDPNKSEKMLQNVIIALRSSMDEIREMIRKEKPSIQQLAVLQLQRLCEDCTNKYGIQATLHMNQDKEIPQVLWEVILDTSIEAVSNALKYANCKHIDIEVRVLPKIVQCYIRDDGDGCIELKSGMGIQGMKERVRKVGGTLHINSEVGFQIQLLLPYNKES